MTLANTLSEGDRVLVANSGVFAAAWGEMAARMGCVVERIDAAPGRAVDPAAVHDRLAADPEHTIKAVLTTHVETASSAGDEDGFVPHRRAVEDRRQQALLPDGGDPTDDVTGNALSCCGVCHGDFLDTEGCSYRFEIEVSCDGDDADREVRTVVNEQGLEDT